MFKLAASYTTDYLESPDRMWTYEPYYIIFLTTSTAYGRKFEWVFSLITNWASFSTVKNNYVYAVVCLS